ncbi:MAG: PqqD family protein [Acidobacteria bacterium]|nr:PqqD family protein [Acidobacteriota bacterium]
MSGKPMVRDHDLVFQVSGNELLIYDLKKNKAYCLNETSALIWNLCNGKNTAAEISGRISSHLGAQVSEDFVLLALNQFADDELMQNDNAAFSVSRGLSRRELIRKVGFASAVALPLISSITAPKAASAQSVALLANCSPCSEQSQCASGVCAFNVICSPGIGTAQPGTPVFGLYCADGGDCCSGSATLVGFDSCVCDPVT